MSKTIVGLKYYVSLGLFHMFEEMAYNMTRLPPVQIKNPKQKGKYFLIIIFLFKYTYRTIKVQNFRYHLLDGWTWIHSSLTVNQGNVNKSSGVQ